MHPADHSRIISEEQLFFSILTIKLVITVSSMFVAISGAICVPNNILSQAVFSHKAYQDDCI